MFDGQLWAIDPKGELAQVIGRRRERLGDQLVIIDPWHIVTEQSDGLNVLDLMNRADASLDGDSEMLASLLSAGHQFTDEPYWSDMATGLISGLIAHIASTYPPSERHLGRLRDWLYHDDLDMAIARTLDQKTIKSRMARDQFVAYLATPPEEVTARLAACQSELQHLNSK